MTPEQMKAAAEFIAWAMRNGPWDGCDLEGWDVQEKGVDLGLLERTEYDPEKHGESEFDCEPGDDWYVLAPWIEAIISSHSDSEAR